MPGPGGSLGMCAICGETFLLEILTCKTVKEIEVEGCNQKLFAHDKCIKEWQGKPIASLPEKSPIRQANEKAGTKT